MTMMAMRSWKDCPPATRLWRLAIIALVLTGLVLIADGVWIKAKAQLAQVLLDRAFARSLAGASDVRPWPWADISPVARISVRRLGEDAVVLADASGEALAFGPAHIAGTPLPGEEGTSVISAHRDTHFAWLRHLETGDLVTVHRRDGVLRQFRVRGSRVARFDAANIDAASFGTNLALTTCYPFEATERGPLRYIVEAELVTEADQGWGDQLSANASYASSASAP